MTNLPQNGKLLSFTEQVCRPDKIRISLTFTVIVALVTSILILRGNSQWIFSFSKMLYLNTIPFVVIGMILPICLGTTELTWIIPIEAILLLSVTGFSFFHMEKSELVCVWIFVAISGIILIGSIMMFGKRVLTYWKTRNGNFENTSSENLSNEV